ncbi:conserved hypothetical protein [Pseudomonas aeruginosa 2192]|nr:conserved hypothetical protein [Pseudomonas aeruginosa 2192]
MTTFFIRAILKKNFRGRHDRRHRPTPDQRPHG